MDIVNVKNTNFYRGEKKILENVTFDIEKGDFIALIGENGSGKSTIGLGLAGIEKIDGEVDIKEEIAYLFQNPDDQIVTPKVESEIAFGLENIAMDREEMRKKIDEILKRFGLYEKRNCNTDILSGGEKQRLAVASLVVLDYEFFFFDEPFSMLDIESKSIVKRTIFDLKEEGKTIVAVVHNLEEILLFDKILALIDGKILKYTKEEFFSSWENLEKIGLNKDIFFESFPRVFLKNYTPMQIIEQFDIGG